jgi:hypothetical protein
MDDRKVVDLANLYYTRRSAKATEALADAMADRAAAEKRQARAAEQHARAIAQLATIEQKRLADEEQLKDTKQWLLEVTDLCAANKGRLEKIDIEETCWLLKLAVFVRNRFDEIQDVIKKEGRIDEMKSMRALASRLSRQVAGLSANERFAALLKVVESSAEVRLRQERITAIKQDIDAADSEIQSLSQYMIDNGFLSQGTENWSTSGASQILDRLASREDIASGARKVPVGKVVMAILAALFILPILIMMGTNKSGIVDWDSVWTVFAVLYGLFCGLPMLFFGSSASRREREVLEKYDSLIAKIGQWEAFLIDAAGAEDALKAAKSDLKSAVTYCRSELRLGERLIDSVLQIE